MSIENEVAEKLMSNFASLIVNDVTLIAGEDQKRLRLAFVLCTASILQSLFFTS